MSFVCRALSLDDSRNLHTDEAKQLGAAGLSIVLFWWGGVNRSQAGYGAGAADAHEALTQAAVVGRPAGRPIYFKADEDTTYPAISAYFQGVLSVMPLAQIGALTAFRVMPDLFNHHLISWGWQTAAYSGGAWDVLAQLQKYSLGGYTGGGLYNLDISRSTVADFGQWLPPAGVGVTLPIGSPPQDQASWNWSQNVEQTAAGLTSRHDSVQYYSGKMRELLTLPGEEYL